MNTHTTYDSAFEIICLDGSCAYFVDEYGEGLACTFDEFEELTGMDFADLDEVARKRCSISIPGHQFRFEVNRIMSNRRKSEPADIHHDYEGFAEPTEWQMKPRKQPKFGPRPVYCGY